MVAIVASLYRLLFCMIAKAVDLVLFSDFIQWLWSVY